MHRVCAVVTTVLVSTALGGCGEDHGPTTGVARVAITTAGLDLDADGYMVTVDGRLQRPVSPVDAFTLRDLATGVHTVALSGVAANCVVSGDVAPVVMIAAGDTAQVAFAVACAPMSGGVRVTVATEGLDLDPDGFAVALDGGLEHFLPVNGAILITPVLVGEHSVEVRGVAPNCTVGGASTRAVTLAAGTPGDSARPTVDVAYAVACSAVGWLRVMITTMGVDLPDGYTLCTPEGCLPLAPNDTLVLRVPAGALTLALSGIAANCAVSGANPRPVTVPAGDTADVALAVTCAARTGAVRVAVATTGVDIDPDYTVLVDEVCHVMGEPCDYLARASIDTSAAVTIAGLPIGYHEVFLSDVAPNCRVGGTTPLAATVTNGDTTDLTFVVECTAIERDGWLRVRTSTTGTDLDRDGYTVLVLWSDPESGFCSDPCEFARATVAPNDSVTLHVGPREYSVALTDVAANCVVAGDNPRSAGISVGVTTEVAFAVSCAPLPTTGWLRVTTATTGGAPDPDGYAALVQGACWSEGYLSYCDYEHTDSVSANSAVTFTDVPVGETNVELLGLAPNCAVVGPIARVVSVAAGDTTEVPFEINCPSPGGVRVTLSTLGDYPDTNGYVVRIDGGLSHLAPSSGVITIRDVLAGDHMVRVDSVALNCAVDGGNPRPVSVAPADTTEVTFAVACGPAPGGLWIKVTSSGVDLDADGYDLLIGGVSRQRIGPNADMGGTGVPPGEHTISLADVASNCAVAGSNPRTVNVWPYTTTAVTFAVTCTAIPPGVVASVTVAPESVVTVAGASYWYRATLRDSAGNLLSELTPVTWSGSDPSVATVSTEGLPPWSVKATGIARGRALITATSGGVSGSAALIVVSPVRVVTVTTGTDRDLDGYDVTVDGAGAGGPDRHVAPNDTLSLGLTGDHLVGLVGVASNCTVAGENPRRVVVTPDEDSPAVTFEITCLATGKIAFVSLYQDCYVCDEASPWTTAITVMNEDGSNPIGIASQGASDPAWSPDGARIAFARGDIWVIAATGGTPANLTNHPAWDGWPAWSPDGSRIAFVSDRDGRVDLYLMNADGSAVVRLTNSVWFGGRPSWSPDGSKIAFDCRLETDNIDVCAIGVDGTGLVRLTSHPAGDYGAAWSPDGATIAFATGRYSGAVELALMNPDGSDVRRVGAGIVGDQPAWSPDGRRLAFSWATDPEPCYWFGGCRTYYVAVVNTDGSGLIPTLSAGYSPAWKPRRPESAGIASQ